MIKTRDIILKKGEKVSLSCEGHNGFLYPGEKVAPLLYEVECSPLSWVGGGPHKKPVLVPENSIAISGNPDRSVAVWVSNYK
tara:strand:+ start:801 stop:1046 length:246 start_codon:yes stop_codon:yes gene_type:complete